MKQVIVSALRQLRINFPCIFKVFQFCENFENTREIKPKARFKRRTLHVPKLMQMSENNRFFSFALDSAHVKFDKEQGF